MAPKDCLFCGVSFERTHSAQRYCPQHRNETQNQYMRQFYAERRLPHVEQECVECGITYLPALARKVNLFCSRRCKEQRTKRLEREARVASKSPRPCLHCGSTIGPERRVEAKFCSASCNNRAHQLQRKLRARAGGEKSGFIRAAIFERDGWKCGICCQRVDRQLAYPDPRSASLDHVVPVAEGGSNDPANLRLSHLRCNLSRRDRGGNEQLALVG